MTMCYGMGGVVPAFQQANATSYLSAPGRLELDQCTLYEKVEVHCGNCDNQARQLAGRCQVLTVEVVSM